MTEQHGPKYFHRTHTKPGKPWHEYREDGDSIVCERVTPGATASGGVRRELVKTWEKDGVLISDIDPRAERAYQKLLEEKNAAGS
jgi:hypothetical protein